MKIIATTLGETGGDAVSMTMGLGYLLATALFGVVCIVAVAAQISAGRFRPALYWTTIVATTTVGTTLADFADRSLGLGYAGGVVLLATLLGAALFAWQRALGTIAVQSVATPRAEAFYWLTIVFSQTLGTALGDWTADTDGVGYLGSAALFGAGLLALAIAYRLTRLSRTLLFWSAFVLTRPLGAVVGDFLDKPVAEGGLALSRFGASATLLAAMAILLVVWPQRPARAAV